MNCLSEEQELSDDDCLAGPVPVLPPRHPPDPLCLHCNSRAAAASGSRGCLPCASLGSGIEQPELSISRCNKQQHWSEAWQRRNRCRSSTVRVKTSLMLGFQGVNVRKHFFLGLLHRWQIGELLQLRYRGGISRHWARRRVQDQAKINSITGHLFISWVLKENWWI